MLRINKPFIQLEDLLILMVENNQLLVNPFSGVTIFNVTDTDWSITPDILWKNFITLYGVRLVGKALPPIGTKYLTGYPSDPPITPAVMQVQTETDKLNYVYNWMLEQVTTWVSRNLDDYKRMMDALTESYNPLENYNMVELSGSASKVSDTKSDPGTVTTEVGVFPFNANTAGEANSKPESITKTSATQSTAGYSNATQSMQWTTGDDFGSTPEGNSVAMSKHTRSGNIGVTTSQQMLEQELKLRANSIIDDFLNKCADTCLLAMWK